MSKELLKVDVGGHTLMVDANEFCDMFHFAKRRLQEEYRYCTNEAEQENNLQKQTNAEQLYNFFVNAKNDYSPLKPNGNERR